MVWVCHHFMGKSKNCALSILSCLAWFCLCMCDKKDCVESRNKVRLTMLSCVICSGMLPICDDLKWGYRQFEAGIQWEAADLEIQRVLDTSRETCLLPWQNQDQPARPPLVVTHHPILPTFHSTTNTIYLSFIPCNDYRELSITTINHLPSTEDLEGPPGLSNSNFHSIWATWQSLVRNL